MHGSVYGTNDSIKSPPPRLSTAEMRVQVVHSHVTCRIFASKILAVVCLVLSVWTAETPYYEFVRYGVLKSL